MMEDDIKSMSDKLGDVDAHAEHDEEIANDLLNQHGIDAYNLGDQQIDTIYEIIFDALKLGRKEVQEVYAAAHDQTHAGHNE